MNANIGIVCRGIDGGIDANLPPDLPTINELQAGSFRPPPHLLHPAYKGSSGSAGKLCREKINGDPQHS